MTVRRILLVNDDHIPEVAQLSLEMTAGWEVLTAGSGSEGLAKAAAEQPDAILLDMMMPDMDGSATFEGLRACRLGRSTSMTTKPSSRIQRAKPAPQQPVTVDPDAIKSSRIATPTRRGR